MRGEKFASCKGKGFGKDDNRLPIFPKPFAFIADNIWQNIAGILTMPRKMTPKIAGRIAAMAEWERAPTPPILARTWQGTL